MKHIVRIAPSPTGDLHIGTLRTMYFNWLIANQNDDSQLILRIDDTDLTRSMNSMIRPIYDTVGVYGLHYNTTFKQSDRFDRYKEVANNFVNLGFAKHDDGCIRLDVNITPDFINWSDTITGDKVATKDIVSMVDSQVIIKSDGSPAYNFASAIDDIDYGITWVVRGTDHIINTFRQTIFYGLLGYDLPLYSHVGLLCDMYTGKKYSKRDSDLLDLTRYDKDAVLNFILRLGWSPSKDDKSNNIISRDKAIDLFLKGGKMRAPNCKVDLNKLDWYHKKYIKNGTQTN